MGSMVCDCCPISAFEGSERKLRGEAGRRGLWAELWMWMGNVLDGWGLDAPLYARCLLSIIRQPQEELSDDVGEAEVETTEELETVVKAQVPGGRRRHSLSERSNADAEDGWEAALLECLSTAELEPTQRRDFVKELLRRYRAIRTLFFPHSGKTEEVDSSLDSGVCPSPDNDSFQNYDEAFPPLLSLGAREFLGLPPPILISNQSPPPSPPSIPSLLHQTPFFPPQSRLRHQSHAPLCQFSAYNGVGLRSRLSSGSQPFTTQWSRPRFGSCPPRGWLRNRTISEGYGCFGVEEVGGLAQLTSATATPVAASFDASDIAPTFVVPKMAQTPTSVKIVQMVAPTVRPMSGPGSDLWSWVSAQAASVHANNAAHQPPPPSPGLPDLLPHDLLHIINEDDGDFPASTLGTGFWPSMGAFSAALAADLGKEEDETPDDPLTMSNGFFYVPRAEAKPSVGPAHREFQPIRTPAMEAAFVPSPQPMNNFFDGEEWFVLQDKVDPRVVQSNVCSGATKRRGETLPLKFQAGKRAKEVQTEKSSPEPDGAWDSFDASDNDWDRWRPAEELDSEWLPESPNLSINPPQPDPIFSFGEGGNRIVSLGAGSSIWEAVPRTAVPAWNDSKTFQPNQQPRSFDTQSEAADDELLLSLVGGISVHAPL